MFLAPQEKVEMTPLRRAQIQQANEGYHANVGSR